MRLTRHNISSEEKVAISEFSSWILNIGDGTIDGIKDSENEDATWIKIPEKYLIQCDSDPIQNISNTIYTDFLTNFNNIEYLKDQTIVAPRNKTVDQINQHILSLLPSDSKTYYSCDTISPSHGNVDELNLLYLEEFLNSLNFNGLPPHELTLKIDTPIMLLRNLNQLWDYVTEPDY